MERKWTIKYKRILFVLFFLISCICGKEITISGKIVDEDSTAIENARINFFSEKNSINQTIYSDANGKYSITIKIGPNNMDEPDIVPVKYELYQNYPNPFNPGTWIPFYLPKTENIEVIIYNLLGQKVYRTANRTFQQGHSQIYWNGTDLQGNLVSAGVYIYCLKSESNFITKKMVLLDGGGSSSLAGVRNVNYDQNIVLNKTTIIDDDTLDITVQKDSLVDITSEQIIINDLTVDYNKNFRLFSQYHLCYDRVDSAGHWQVFINTIDGNAEVNISNNSIDDCYYPKWSPDGRYIVFRWDKPVGGSDIYCYDVQSDTLSNLTTDLSNGESASAPFWTPGGDKIIFDIHKMGRGTYPYIMNQDGGNKTILTHTPYRFLNDSYNYFYVEGDTIYKTDLDSTYNKVVLSNIDSLGKINMWLDDIDPDNEMIICHEDSALWTYCYSNILKTYDIKNQVLDTIATTTPDWHIVDPKFSHDYSKITFLEETRSMTEFKLNLFEDNFSEQLLSFSGEDVRFGRDDVLFSPNDKYLAFTKCFCENGYWFDYLSQIYILDLEANTLMLLDAEDSFAHQWNPTIKY